MIDQFSKTFYCEHLWDVKTSNAEEKIMVFFDPNTLRKWPEKSEQLIWTLFAGHEVFISQSFLLL